VIEVSTRPSSGSTSRSQTVGSTFVLSTDLSYFVPFTLCHYYIGFGMQEESSKHDNSDKKHKERKNSEIVIPEVKLDLLSWVEGRET